MVSTDESFSNTWIGERAKGIVWLCVDARSFLRRRPWHPVVYRAILWLQCESHSHQWNQRHTGLPPLPQREEARLMFQISTRFQRGRFVRLNWLTRRNFLSVHSKVACSNVGLPNYMTSRQPFALLAIFFGQASSMQSAFFPFDLLVWSWLFQCKHQKINCWFSIVSSQKIGHSGRHSPIGQLLKVHCSTSDEVNQYWCSCDNGVVEWVSRYNRQTGFVPMERQCIDGIVDVHISCAGFFVWNVDISISNALFSYVLSIWQNSLCVIWYLWDILKVLRVRVFCRWGSFDHKGLFLEYFGGYLMVVFGWPRSMWWRSWRCRCFVVIWKFFCWVHFGRHRLQRRVIWMYCWRFFVHSGSACFSVGIRSVLKMFAKKSAGKNRGCRESGKRVGRGVATQSRARFAASKQHSAFARHDGSESDQGGTDRRLVGSWRDVRSSTFGWWRSWRGATAVRGRRTISARALCGGCWWESWVFKTARMPVRRRCFLLTSSQKCRSICKLVETTWWDDFSGSMQEQSWLNSTNGLRKFIEVDKHQAGRSEHEAGMQRAFIETWRMLSGELGSSGFLTRSCLFWVEKEGKRSFRHSCWGDTVVRRSSVGLVIWFGWRIATTPPS